MSMRDKLQENIKLVAGAVVVLVILALVLAIRTLHGTTASSTVEQVTKIYYTDDDGQSYFADGYEKLGTDFVGPHGQKAVVAHVFRYPGEKPFVGWMENYTPEGKKLLAQYYQDPSKKGTAPPQTEQFDRQRMVKRPGQKVWVPALSPDVTRITLMEKKNGQGPEQIAPE